MYGLRQFHHRHNKEEEERRELAKKQQLLNKHRRGELHWTIVGEDRSGEEVKQSSYCHMVERPPVDPPSNNCLPKNIEQPLSA
jgi:hypothetical protein